MNILHQLMKERFMLLAIIQILALWESVIVLCFVVRYFLSILFCNHLDGEERAGCFA